MNKDRIVRVIPRLDVKGPHLVKGIHLEGLRCIGFPQDYAKYYYENGADELIFQDVVASLFNRNSLKEFITNTAKDMFVPLTVGGGIRSLDDINDVLRAGADRVSINTAAIKDPKFIKEAALAFGTSTIVATIETIQQPNGDYHCFIDNGREATGIDAFDWAKTVQDLGAGEIFLTSVDKEGRGDGFDTELIKKMCNMLDISVVAHGGAGKYSDVENLIKETSIGGIALASILHYDFLKTYNVDVSTETEGNFEFLKKPIEERVFRRIIPMSLNEVKTKLKMAGINCRQGEV